MHYSYLFEAHTIQRYIMDSGKLKGMVGASEILERLTAESADSPLDALLNHLKLKTPDNYCFSRRGGGAFYIDFLDDNALSNAQLIMNIWTFIVNEQAPGLAFNHVISSGKDDGEAIEKGQERLRELRSQPQLTLPEITPLVRRSPRTGQAVVIKDKKSKAWLDVASVQKQDEENIKGEALTKKFLPDLDTNNPEFVFPINMEPDPDHKSDTSFPFKNGNHTVGIIHADGNGFGEILLKLGDKLKEKAKKEAGEERVNRSKLFLALSKAIDDATQEAAQEALKIIKEKTKEEQSNKDKLDKKSIVLPVRPLILGGDDLTLIVRGDYALQYARDFMRAFEKKTEQRLGALRSNKDYLSIKDYLPEKLTACAGVTFMKSNQPFSLGYSLAESLCSAAKTASRKNLDDKGTIPASLVFHRVTSSFIEDYKYAKERELTASFKDKYSLTLGAYGVGDVVNELPRFDALEKIKKLFQKSEMAKGPTRHFLTMMHTDPREADEVWNRWVKGMKSDKNRKQILKEYQQEVATLFNKEGIDNKAPFRDVTDNSEDDSDSKIVQETFIGDLISWMAAEGETHAN